MAQTGRLRIHQFTMSNGERFSLLQDCMTGIPAVFPTLYVTSQVRCLSQSLSAMEQHLGAINVLLTACQSRKFPIDLESRFRRKEFLEIGEIQDIADACKLSFSREAKSSREPHSSQKKGYKNPARAVESSTVKIRLLRIAQYIEWLANVLLTSPVDMECSFAIEKMKRAILARCPDDKGLNDDADGASGLSEEEEVLLFDMLTPGNPNNPFVGPGIQKRNSLIVKLLRLHGLRGGELLNLRVGDINFNDHLLYIYRRADAKADPRRKQPLTKTRSRVLKLSPSTVEEIRDYVVGVRKKVPNATRGPYLFVVHKSGPTRGQPLTISGYRQVFHRIEKAAPELGIRPHGLRHTWNERFSDAFEKLNDGTPSSELRQMRNQQMGWNRSSKTGERYNKRHIERKGNEANLQQMRDIEERVKALRKSRGEQSGDDSR